MKKLLTLSITLILVLALSACDNTSNDRNVNQQSQNGSSLTSNSNSSTPSTPSTSSNQNQQQSNQTTSITRERALEIALEKAGVKQADIRDLDIELDYERGVKVWEIDFEHGNLEYSYDVNAETGAITKIERERDN